MNETSLGFLTTAFSIILTGVVSYFFTRQQKRDDTRDKKEEERDKARQTRSEMLTKLMTTQEGLIDKISVLADRQENILNTQEKIKAGLKISLQGELLSCYRQYSHNGNQLTSDDFAHWLNTYNAYHDIGGNSFCERLHQAVSSMEIVDEKKED